MSYTVRVGTILYLISEQTFSVAEAELSIYLLASHTTFDVLIDGAWDVRRFCIFFFFVSLFFSLFVVFINFRAHIFTGKVGRLRIFKSGQTLSLNGLGGKTSQKLKRLL